MLPDNLPRLHGTVAAPACNSRFSLPLGCPGPQWPSKVPKQGRREDVAPRVAALWLLALAGNGAWARSVRGCARACSGGARCCVYWGCAFGRGVQGYAGALLWVFEQCRCCGVKGRAQGAAEPCAAGASSFAPRRARTSKTARRRTAPASCRSRNLRSHFVAPGNSLAYHLRKERVCETRRLAHEHAIDSPADCTVCHCAHPVDVHFPPAQPAAYLHLPPVLQTRTAGSRRAPPCPRQAPG